MITNSDSSLEEVSIEYAFKDSLLYKIMDKNSDGVITYEEVLNFGMNVNKNLLSIADVQF